MNKLKTITHALTLLLLAGAFLSCSNTEDGGSISNNVSFVVSKASMTYTKNGGQAQFAVQTPNGEPSVEVSGSWLTLSKRVSTGVTFNYSLTAAAYPVSSESDYSERTATVTVRSGSEVKTIAVTQTPHYGLIVSDPSSKTVNIGAAGGSVTVKLRANTGSIGMSTPNGWITLPGAVRSGLADYERTFTVAVNVSAARTGTVDFTITDDEDNESITESVTIVQEAAQNTGNMSHSAAELAKLMYPGWNLGNTLEGANGNYIDQNMGTGTETHWQNTKTTQAVIDYVKSLGFRSVRIPCNWVNGHIIDSSSSTIDPDWMARVKEIVDYCIVSGLYVVLNDHYDGGWIESDGFSNLDESNVSAKEAKLKRIWTQIATAFKDYDEHLLFAGLNEPFHDQGSANKETYKAQVATLVRYEQAFIDAVRATGGNNALRTLIVQGPETNINNTNTYYTALPADAAEGRLMFEVHFYDPWQFCGLEEKASWGDTFYYYNSENYVSGSSHNCTWGDGTHALTQFAKMKAQFVDKGIPVILGEYGANWRALGSDEDQDKHNASIKAFYKTVTKSAIDCGIVPFVWDINATNQYGTKGIMTIIDRKNLSVFCQYGIDGITEGVTAATWPY